MEEDAPRQKRNCSRCDGSKQVGMLIDVPPMLASRLPEERPMNVSYVKAIELMAWFRSHNPLIQGMVRTLATNVRPARCPDCTNTEREVKWKVEQL